MKIIYLIAGTYRAAGMERVLSQKANRLASEGNDVLVVTTDQRGRVPAFHFDHGIRSVDLGINYETGNGGSFVGKLIGYPIRQILHRCRLARILKAEKADIVVSMFCNDVSFLPAIKDGSRKLLEVHFSRFKRLQYGRRGLWRIADRIRSRHEAVQASRFDSFVVLTEEDLSYWEADFRKAGLKSNIVCIPNARTFAPEELPLRPEGSPRTVLAVGRYSDQKAFDRLVECWKLIPEAVREGWRLRIVGDGENRGQLEKLVVEKSLSDSVALDYPSDNMPQIYADADIYALCSRYEGLPMVLLEAQAAGLPIVAMRCKCGPADVVSDGEDGFLVPEADILAMSDKLMALMKDEILREKMSRRAVSASDRFDVDAIMSRWDAIFNDLCAR